MKSYKRIVDTFCTRTEETKEHIIHRGFVFDGNRYMFDWKYCEPPFGWKQYDTDQDAWYFGVWVNLNELATVTYAEGDVVVKILKDQTGMKAELDRMKNFYGDAPAWCVGINTDTGEVTKFYDERPSL